MQDLAVQTRYSFVGGPFGSNLTSADYVDAPGVPVIRGINLDGRNSRFIDDHFVFVSDAKAASLQPNMAYPGDLVFTQRGTLGQVAEIPLNSRFPRYVVSQSQMKMSVDGSKATTRYLYHFYRSPIGARLLASKIQATGVPHINLSLLREFPVLLPPLPEQKRIAAILDEADIIRRKRWEAIRLTEELLRSAFLHMFGDPVTNTKGWKMKKLGEMLDVATGGTPSRAVPEYYGGTIPWVTTGEVTGGFINSTTEHLTERGLKESNCKIFPRGTVVLAMYGQGATRGRCAVLGIDAATNQACAAIQPTGSLPGSYLFTMLRLRYDELRALGRGGNQPNLNLSLVRGIDVPVPTGHAVQRFAELFSKHAALLDKHAELVATTDALSESATQHAFSGRL